MDSPLFITTLAFEFIGELLIAISVVRVHIHLLKEHKLDRDVYRTIKKEKMYVLLGIVFMFISFILQIYLK